ncbi:3-dehydroquinate dehydratase [Odoribacter laneus]|jgi:3-dehydroquinate dehydratase, type II|uniref:type II 3-dehydroquinate dehydratase n=1 Tax=Odoribacter laneus TaxID=626933 RepID=UPI0018976CBD|nr:type II 3-dehydroquinate dehydratase [Odoribacter laneus]GKI20725.1 3-dehydroquinate dehydratase [Odoribacter laneus]GKI23989.1 3-dehydroquinate dehydratase [Odoribacter laneus]
MKILILNGPNLNLLGVREPDVYGKMSFDNYLEELRKKYPEETIVYYQSNSEGQLIDKIHEVGFEYDGIIFNAGGYTHTSVAIADAVSAVKAVVIEVHISNIARREGFRHTSFLAPVCEGSIAGFGLDSYELALQALRLRNRRHS